MSTPVIVGDPAIQTIDTVIEALAWAFNPDSYPPAAPGDVAGGTRNIHFFAGDAAIWNAPAEGGNCDDPFVWVRVHRRYRTKHLPNPVADASNCNLPRAIALEVGVGRCAILDAEPTIDQYDAEADRALDDSWRLETALCRASKQLQADNYQVATSEIIPQGPDGGIVCWAALLHCQFG